MSREQTISARIELPALRALEALARRRERSVGGEIRVAVSRHLAAELAADRGLDAVVAALREAEGER